MCMWNPGSDGMIHRSSRMANTIPGISRFPCGVLLAQHRIEAVFLDEIRKYPAIKIQRNVVPTSMEIDRNQTQCHDSHAITIKMRKAVREHPEPTTNRVDGPETLKRKYTNVEQSPCCQETIRAKYVIGCDGAHSWTRAQHGFQMEGEHTEYIWGVLDIIPLTDFPGDAIHTHSPKAGQGMNVSIQDAYNLGWKLALVVKGIANPSILKTYETERRSVAQELIAFDQNYSKLWSSRPKKDRADPSGVSMTDFARAFVKQQLFTSGFGVNYGPNILTAKDSSSGTNGMQDSKGGEASSEVALAKSHQHLASKTMLGQRFPSFKVVNHCDARSWQFARWLRADGFFHIIVFAGDVSQPGQMGRVHTFASEMTTGSHMISSQHQSRLCSDSESFRYEEGIAQLLTIHSAPRQQVELHDFPPLLRPYDEKLGYDYNRIFVDGESYYEGHGHAYEGYGVDPSKGCVIVVRPDQYVAWIGELEDVQGLETYFAGILMEPRSPNRNEVRGLVGKQRAT
ncbi:MAG: hypothetical protein Q9188_001910 [Gyalolechia gomerana]